MVTKLTNFDVISCKDGKIYFLPVTKMALPKSYSIEDEVEGRSVPDKDTCRSFVLDLKMRFQCAKLS